MASPPLPKRGRPKLGIDAHQIGLRMDVYNQWLVLKDIVGMADKTHSEFASHLLEVLEEMTRLKGENRVTSPQAHGEPFIFLHIYE